MNPSTAFARVLVDELLRGGVTDAVLAPGSRSAPVALALAAAERDGRLRLHVRIDERSAAFLALGLAKASGRPVPVLTTSGTAAAHLHAAVLEADAAGVPLLALTADRPPELRSTGANQTIEQAQLYGGAVRWAVDVGVPEVGREAAQNRYWRSVVAKALVTAAGVLSGDPGPVHLNLALRDPLMPADEGVAELAGPWAGRPGGAPWTAAVTPGAVAGARRLPPRTLVIGGDGAADADLGRPVVAEPSSASWARSLRGGVFLLGDADWLAVHRPDHVVVLGRPTLSRPVNALLADPAVTVETVSAAPRWADAVRSSTRVSPSLAVAAGNDDVDDTWARAWSDAAERAGAAVDAALDAAPELTAARLARDVVAALPSGALLVLGSSTPVRDVDRLAVPRADLTVLANRGVAGIDGTISTAIGAATVHGGPAFALMGDLTFLHDLTGLLTGEGEPVPDLTVVVPDNDGGGIFAQLEPGEERYAEGYRRVFGTPHGRDLVAVAGALGWAATRVGTPEELPAALRLGGPRVVVVRTDQRAEAALAKDLRAAASEALRGN
ncbi:2-succinyl-5-enolpyruvyl-6-hydroxy-3-cyclohexene-1-carboxylic-acid synthase [Blastococcus sp. TML/M2B]|uniref:2-succinyl-5-enolpyruvyl-6-hydroxy-3- cyclohexene-1-carboxylic-acid synthase n=1 Tax=unclassified Blastococcus TaxID=2619396 RepID=UPI001909320A|nr:2-succinyl-5-enolpyruvyl-6-hydroxy-3-cyclohexene-1-carboxylic-acid synthase [Blastococcus sp. TML/C7B]MBN1094057.1 2-succinyl-5-enolpyruvyl-6-hydroxy-3-cyclohexene-1-carboxylic-acid synthase [Blastococcus sp. TML/M2B]MBN1095825.1 2-succinyl-5-enolpyruvyl-6-hydroxy-3-cyclohexene-1-carboxylic-acid synthase [Blastococcus sp. TML/C7B]